MPTPQVTISRTRYLVRLNGKIHRIRADRVCNCGGSPASPCPAIPLVQAYLDAGGEKPPGCNTSSWPETWTTIPSCCPVCSCAVIADRHLDSSHGPGWRCTFDPVHYWLVRLHPLRLSLAARPPRYPWYDTSEEERRTWLETHTHPPPHRSPISHVEREG